MKPESQKYLNDILIAISDIKEFTKSTKSFQQYLKSKVIRRAVERKIAIIGEAVVKLKKIDKKMEIKNVEKLNMLRNLLIQDCDSNQDEISWGIVVKDLNPLKTEIHSLLKN